MNKIYVVEDLRQRLEAVEKDGDGLPTRIRAVVQQADKVNRNKRLYPREVLQREINSFNENPAQRPGLVDHPIGDFPSVADIGIKWEKVWMDQDGLVWGEGTLVKTSKGNDLRAAIAEGIEVGISSRGYATADRVVINGEAVFVIGDDFELETFDAVVDPGVAAARIKQAESLGRPNFTEKEVVMNEEEKATEAVVETEAPAVEEAAPEAEAEVVTEAEVVQAEAEAEVVETLKDEPAVEETVAEEAAAEGAEVAEAGEPVEEQPVAEVPAEEPVVAESEEVETVDPSEALVAAEQRIADLEAENARLNEAVEDAATARAHAANLEALVAALVQSAKDALDRTDFYTTCMFASTAEEASWLARYLKYLADNAEATDEAKAGEEKTLAERAADALGALFAAFEKARVVQATVEECKDEKFGLLLVRKVSESATTVESVKDLIAEKRSTLESALVARRATVAPKGVQEAEKADEDTETDPEMRLALIAHRELQNRRAR